MYESRRYEQDQRPRRHEEPYERQWRDQGDGRFAGTERRMDDRSWEWDSERSTRGMDGGYRGGERQDRTSGGFDTDRWMDSPRPIGDRDSSRAWRGTGAGSNAGERENFTGRGPKGFRRSDDRIREQVCERLADDSRVDASEIEVDVKNGEVTLKGTVRDRQQKRRAEDLAESCSGVSDVTNHIRLSKDQSSRDRESHSSQRTQPGSQKTNGRSTNADASM